MNTVPLYLVGLIGSFWPLSMTSPESITLALAGIALSFIMYIRAQVIEFNKFVREERRNREAMIQAVLIADGRMLL